MCNRTYILRCLAVPFYIFVLSASLMAQISPCAASILQSRSILNGVDPFEVLQIPCASRDAPQRPQAGPPETSVDILRHPVTPRALRLLLKARDLAQAGNHTAAIQSLQQTMTQQRSAIPYGHGLLGIEYIRIGQYQSAVDELEQAMVLMPHQPEIPSNLAVSLYLLGQFDRAEQEVRHSLVLDPTSPQARKILEVLLSRKTSAENISTP